MALEQYRLHFQSQFVNTFHADPVPRITEYPSIELSTSVFPESRIALSIINSRDGNRFSPSKCIVISPSLTVQSLYEAPLALESHFNYLGVEFTSAGISEALHVANRISKAEKQAAALAGIGARYLGFPVPVPSDSTRPSSDLVWSTV